MIRCKLHWLTRAMPLVLVLPFFASCVSNAALDRALEEKDQTISELRDERTRLKAQIQSLSDSRDEALGQLVDANTPTPVEASTEKKESFADLDSVGVSYGVRGGNMVLSIPSSITFGSGKADLSESGRKALKKVASTLKTEYPDAHFSVEGHTDADPIKKSGFASNRDLSVARAMAVLRYLVEDCGVPDDRCVVAGHGQYDPVAANASDADKAKNRRVDIVVLRKRS